MGIFKIKISTNEYQAARNVAFPAHCTTIYSDSFLSKEEAIKGLKQLVMDEVSDDCIAYDSPESYIDHIIYGHCEESGIKQDEWVSAHPRLIPFLAKKEGFTVPGVYENDSCIYEFGAESFEYDGYYYKVIII